MHALDLSRLSARPTLGKAGIISAMKCINVPEAAVGDRVGTGDDMGLVGSDSTALLDRISDMPSEAQYWHSVMGAWRTSDNLPKKIDYGFDIGRGETAERREGEAAREAEQPSPCSKAESAALTTPAVETALFVCCNRTCTPASSYSNSTEVSVLVYFGHN